MRASYRVMWNCAGIWKDCEQKAFLSLKAAKQALRACENAGGAPHQIWKVVVMK